jgi:adenosine deaminase
MRSDSVQFQDALRSGDIKGLARIPKSDLHNHSILGARIEDLEAWTGTPLRRPPSHMTSLDEMISYANNVLYPHLLNREGFEFAARSAIKSAISDGVTVLEMSLDVRFMSLYDDFPDGFLSFVRDLVASNKSGINFRPEIGMSKDRSADDQIRRAMLCIESGLFRSVDLYGNETAQPPDPFRPLYCEARRHGLKLKAHAGEFAGPDVIEHTLDILEIDEVQHGVTAAFSKQLMARLRQDSIRLNVCPSSNLALGVVREISQHPIRSLVDNGLRVTLNSDDLTIFGQSVTHEFLLLYRSGLLSAQELDSIRHEGLLP